MKLTYLDQAICLGYLAVVLGLGLWCAKDQHDNEDYFVGGRKMNWFLVGLSIFAGTFSSLSFVGLPREAAYDDYHLMIGILFIPFVVLPIVSRWFLPFYETLEEPSPYSYLEKRFHRSVRLLASLLFMLYTVCWMGNMLVAVGKILEVVLELPADDVKYWLVGLGMFAMFYTALGGVKAIIWTDALQAIALGGGMIFVLVLALQQVEGGWSEVIKIGNEHQRFEMFRMELDFQHPNFFAACAFGAFVYLAGLAVNFTSVQRYISMPNIQAVRRSLWVNGIMVTLVCGIFFLVGSVLFAYYQQHDTAFYELLKADEGLGREGREDQLLPAFVMNVLPNVGLVGLLLAGLFSAAMSSLDSGMNSLTASVVWDWSRGRQLDLRFSRLLTVLFGVATIRTALFLQEIGGPVFHVLMTIAGTFLGLILGLFLLGLLFPKVSTSAALTGFSAGAAAVIVAHLQFGISGWWDGAITTLTTLIVGVSVNFLLSRIPRSSIGGA